jgi:hypothetical protein
MFGAGLGFDFEFRFWVHEDFARSESALLPSLNERVDLISSDPRMRGRGVLVCAVLCSSLSVRERREKEKKFGDGRSYVGEVIG